ncbi:MAG: hypothetical protein ACRDXC_10505, partial [Acidimicrobiales bacterium]
MAVRSVPVGADPVDAGAPAPDAVDAGAFVGEVGLPAPGIFDSPLWIMDAAELGLGSFPSRTSFN